MANEIPTRSRLIVKERDGEQCYRCGSSGAEWSHRRPRAVKGGHFQHCPCNGLWMCRTCHAFCHANPAEARTFGWFVSSSEDAPYTVPAKAYYGWHLLDCDGNATYTTQPKEQP